MLSQALEVFRKEYEKNKDDMILGEYIPADGTYVIVEPENEGFTIAETFEIKIDKKTRKIDRTISKYMKFVCLADYYSKVSDMNKAILSASGKVIQGNNYLSFVIKKDSLTNGKLSLDIIDKFYDTLEDPKQKYKKQSLELYEIAEKKLGEVDREKLNRIRSWIKENLFEEFKEIIGKDYLKIFFHYPEEEYFREGERYLIPNIYNKNEYNKKSEGSIYGLPNDNMGLNPKKPYLENKTRETTVPYLVGLQEALIQRKFFDYLMNQASIGKNNIYISDKLKPVKNNELIDEDFSGIFMRVQKGKEAEIQDFDVIPSYSYKMEKIFDYRNKLGIDEEKLGDGYDNSIETLKEMQRVINEVLFNKLLSPNYFTKENEIPVKDGKLKHNILMCRTALFNWFYKGKSENIWKLLDKVSIDLVKNSLGNGHFRKVNDQFNLRMSLKEYFEGGKEMSDTVVDIKNSLRDKLLQKETGNIESDREYFFAVGQLVSFFISRSKGKKKPLSLANPFINAKKDKVIKEKLKALYRKYNYDIESWDYRFKGLYAMVLSYELNGKIDDDMVIAGYLHSNLLYEKSKDKAEDKNKKHIQEGAE